ncbi:MAG: DEAD/DEAH box helicase family protein [Thermoflexales bacterium]
MITLKHYQTRVLDTLTAFFRQCSKDGHPEAAFQQALSGNGQAVLPYFPVQAEGLNKGMPYVCLRVPTGGGKTLLACHAAGLAMSELLRTDRSVLLWLVPSNTILNQTADALRDPRHDYRRALELACGPIEVVTIDEALRLSRATVDGQTVVIVATIQSFRVEDQTGRKVYEQNGAFSEHLLNLPADRLADLLPGPDGKPKPSLVNMLRLRRPIVIVDEAHNARTDLSFATLGNVLPSCIIEFTATPARAGQPSNVLHRVSAAELKAEDMVKLPLRVIARPRGEGDKLLTGAIDTRAQLEALAIDEAQRSGEYLRPILLLQAERVDACEPLRKRLNTEFNIPLEQIKISVGNNDELPGADEIASPRCPVRFILTVQKLREGWDCPFAYVLCSLKETRSSTAIEQIVGRILRLPHARAKQHPDLNCSYAFSVSPSITDVLAELRDALEHNGFTAAEADRIVIAESPSSFALSAQPITVQVMPQDIDAAMARQEEEALKGKAIVSVASGDITILMPLDVLDTERLKRCVTTREAKDRIEITVDRVREVASKWGDGTHTLSPSPYARGERFNVPRLCVRDHEAVFEFDRTVLLEHRWKLSDKDASLPDSYSPLARPVPRMGNIDIGAQGEVKTSVATSTEEPSFLHVLHQQVLALGVTDGMPFEALVSWIDRRITHGDIAMAESTAFILRTVNGLLTKHSLNGHDALVQDRYRLRDEIEARIDEHRAHERKAAFQQFLLPDAPLFVSDDNVILLSDLKYAPGWTYSGGFEFTKHYFGPKVGELQEKKANGDTTEEFKCAQYLDQMPEVKYWVRNLANRPGSFRLQTSSDWFYPDFVCELADGRILVVENKGAHLYSADDSQEKRAIGQVWADRSNGRCLFVMPTGGNFDSIAAVIRTK